MNAQHLINNDEKSGKIKEALDLRKPEIFFDGSQLAILNYAEKLTCTPGEMKKSDIGILKKAGVEDGEILEANQIICYFNYVNRSINGLGVSTEGDTVGYYSEE